MLFHIFVLLRLFNYNFLSIYDVYALLLGLCHVAALQVEDVIVQDVL